MVHVVTLRTYQTGQKNVFANGRTYSYLQLVGIKCNMEYAMNDRKRDMRVV